MGWIKNYEHKINFLLMYYVLKYIFQQKFVTIYRCVLYILNSIKLKKIVKFFTMDENLSVLKKDEEESNLFESCCSCLHECNLVYIYS